MGSVIQFQSLPPDKRRTNVNRTNSNPYENSAKVSEVVIFPGVRIERKVNKQISDMPGSRFWAGESPAE